MDFAGACFDSGMIKWWENDGNLMFSGHILIAEFDYANSLQIVDMDGDSVLDITASCGSIDDHDDPLVWLKNNDDRTFTKFVIDSDFIRLHAAVSADLDQDGDMDVVGGEYFGDIAWWENQPNVVVDLEMPTTYFREGDPCRLTAQITNHSNQDLEQIPLFVILDVYGEYWFWPTWTQTGEYQLIDIPMGLQEHTIIEPFTWPPNTGSAIHVIFWGALTKTDFSDVLGTFGFWEFGWGM